MNINTAPRADRPILFTDFHLGLRCRRQLQASLARRRDRFGGRPLTEARLADLIDPPTDSIQSHRFLETYRVGQAHREDLWLQMPELRQVYPGETASVVEAYAGTIGEIGRRSKLALDSLLAAGEGALADLLLLIEGRLLFIDLIQLSARGLKITLLRPDSKLKDGHYREAAWLLQGLTAAHYQVAECSLRILNHAYRSTDGTNNGAAAGENNGAAAEADAEADDGTAELFVERRLSRRQKFMRHPIAEILADMEDELRTDSIAPCSNPHCALCAQPQPQPQPPGNSPLDNDNDNDNIAFLRQSSGLAPRLREQGIERLSDLDKAPLPLREKLKASHWIQHRAAREGREQIDAPALREFLDSLQWPLYFLDFECFLEAIPPWNAAGVWEHLPFLFSLHTMDRNSEPRKLIHYLIDDGQDRREEFARRLIAGVGKSGSILVYGIALEMRALRHLADAVPVLKDELLGLTDRLVDLQKPFTSLAYYSPEQRGKTSLKTLFGLLTGGSYSQQQIASGIETFTGYYYLIHQDITLTWDKQADHIRSAPEQFLREVVEYCDIDSIAMAGIVKTLIEKAGWISGSAQQTK